MYIIYNFQYFTLRFKRKISKSKIYKISSNNQIDYGK